MRTDAHQKKGSILISGHADPARIPRWRLKDQASQKSGPHATVYLINGDRYIGDWKANKRHGKGMHLYKKSGEVYEGEWFEDARQGYGTLSVPVAVTTSLSKQKEEDQEPTAAESIFGSGGKKKKESDVPVQLRKVYTGEWLNDKRHGHGTFFYDNGNVYEGKWEFDMKEGWGKMTYADSSIYEGEWHRENRHGQGILLLSIYQ